MDILVVERFLLSQDRLEEIGILNEFSTHVRGCREDSLIENQVHAPCCSCPTNLQGLRFWRTVAKIAP